MKLIKENYIFFILILLLFFVDRLSKNTILSILEDKNYLFINEYLNLNLVFNTGIGFGLLSFNGGWYYSLLSIFIFFIILALIFFMLKSRKNEKIFFFIYNWRCYWKFI